MLSRWVAAIAAAGSITACSSSVTVATFNIRLFPEGATDRSRVADELLALDASAIAVQEIRDAWALGQVLDEVSERSDHDYALLLGPCGGAGQRITTGVVYDQRIWEVVEHVGYPDLRVDGTCDQQPGTLGVLQDRRGERLGVLSVHMRPFPRNFDERKVQWGQLVERLAEIEGRHHAPVLAMGDFNSTGFTSEPVEERPFVEGVVRDAGHSLATAELDCTEYWRPPGDAGPYRPSILDHIVATGGTWSEPEVRGMCERMGCRPTDPAAMDPDYFSVSDHCPVVMRGKL